MQRRKRAGKAMQTNYEEESRGTKKESEQHFALHNQLRKGRRLVEQQEKQ
jgi:hypothetical protein